MKRGCIFLLVIFNILNAYRYSQHFIRGRLRTNYGTNNRHRVFKVSIIDPSDENSVENRVEDASEPFDEPGYPGIEDNVGERSEGSQASIVPLDQIRLMVSQITEHSSISTVRNTVQELLKFSQVRALPEKLWCSAMDACLKRKSDLFALDIFKSMINNSISCTSHQLTNLLTIVSGKLSYEDTLDVFDKAVSAGLQPTVHNFSPLLKSCGSARQARQILARMQLAKIEPNVISFSAAIKSCELAGDWKSSVELLELMRAYGVQPNEITYCCIISAASKGWAGDIAVSILREMESAGFPPNPLCYACAITACARCKSWAMVEKLFLEMEELGMPLQESILISIINCCRSSVKPPKHILLHSEDTNEYSRNEWAKALWIINQWASKADHVTESLYTIAMDVLQEAGRYKEIVDLYFKMLGRCKGATKSALSFAFRACEKLKNPDIALKLFESACDRGQDTVAMTGSVMLFATSSGRLDVALQAFQRSCRSELQDENKSLPLPLTRRIVKDVLDHMELHGDGNDELYNGLLKIILASLRNGRPALDVEEYQRFMNTVVAKKKYADILKVMKRSFYTLPNRGFQLIYEYACVVFCNSVPLPASVDVIIRLIEEVLEAKKPKASSQLLLDAMGAIYNNVSYNDPEFVPDRKRRKRDNAKAVLLFKLYSEGRRFHVQAKEQIATRSYRLAALACRNGDLPDEMAELYAHCKEDGIVDKAVFSQAIYVLSKSKKHASIALDIFEDLRGLNDAPDTYMYTSALVACENCLNWKKALDLLDSMRRQGLPLNTFVFTTAIAACAASGQADEALALLDLMMDTKLECSVWTFNAAIFACAKTGRWRDALTVFEIMREKMSKAPAAEDRDPGSPASENEFSLTISDEESHNQLQETLMDLNSDFLQNKTAESFDFDADEESSESYMESFNIANIVTYNTLIEALGEGEQFMLVDEVYKDALKKGIVNPLANFQSKGLIDLHFHSRHMGNAALRYVFESMLSDPSVLGPDGELSNAIVIIIGKGDKLKKAIQSQLKNEFRPAIRSSVLNRNVGRLVLSYKDVSYWLRTHKSIRSSSFEEDASE